MIAIKTIVLYRRKAPTPFSEWNWMIVVGENFFLRGKLILGGSIMIQKLAIFVPIVISITYILLTIIEMVVL